jgi:hypothetical protein
MKSLRKVIEINVVAYNSPLKETVKSMDIITLLRNCHPIDRITFAYALLRDKVINKYEAKEFVKLVGE